MDAIYQATRPRFGLSQADQDAMFQQLPSPTAASVTPVGITEIRSLVCRGKGQMPGFSYVVPGFAVHWGLVIRGTLFHLRYVPSTNGNSVKFRWTTWDEESIKPGNEISVIGATIYSTDDIIATGILPRL
jgi:hypothetical protein